MAAPPPANRLEPPDPMNSPRSRRKTFADILSSPVGPASVEIKEPKVYCGKPAVVFTKKEADALAAKYRFSLVGKFSHGRPTMDTIRNRFSAFGLKGTYQIGLIDARHVLITFGLEEDFIRLWMKPTWYIDGAPMRLFKWSKTFHPRKESPIVPCWISFPHLPVYLFEKSALFSIANLVGKPLKIDEPTLNVTRPSQARVCIELDISRPKIGAVWVAEFDEDAPKDEGYSGFWQEVEYECVPYYCSYCHHVGHQESGCLQKGTSQSTKPQSASAPLKPKQPEKVYVAKDKGKGIAQEGTRSNNPEDSNKLGADTGFMRDARRAHQGAEQTEDLRILLNAKKAGHQEDSQVEKDPGVTIVGNTNIACEPCVQEKSSNVNPEHAVHEVEDDTQLEEKDCGCKGDCDCEDLNRALLEENPLVIQAITIDLPPIESREVLHQEVTEVTTHPHQLTRRKSDGDQGIGDLMEDLVPTSQLERLCGSSEQDQPPLKALPAQEKKQQAALKNLNVAKPFTRSRKTKDVDPPPNKSMINLMSWNVRGIRKKSTVRRLRKLKREHGLELLLVQEPMLEEGEIQNYRRRLGFEGAATNLSSKIWVFWCRSFSCRILLDHDQFLHMEVTHARVAKPFLVTVVYAKCNRQLRRELWEALATLADPTKPWMLIGDFNVITSLEEQRNARTTLLGPIDDFNAAIRDCGVHDAGYEGNQFTWSNGRVLSRLDRALINPGWGMLFLQCSVFHLSRATSDHAPLLVKCATQLRQPKLPFKFQHMWVSHHTFQSVIKLNWELPIRYNGMRLFYEKLKRLKICLKQWNHDVFGNLFSCLQEHEEKVLAAERLHEENSNAVSRAHLNSVRAQYNLWLAREEIFWRQRSRVKWLKDGDRNSSYFHAITKNNVTKKYIHKIQVGQQWLTSLEDIKASAAQFFSRLLSLETGFDPTEVLRDADFSFIPSLLTREDNCSLMKRPNLEELKEVVWSLDEDSVPGVDGFDAKFYKACWEIISGDLLTAVIDVFDNGDLPQGVTSTAIALIPKVQDAASWSDYRPISLCTVLNKILTKLMARRLGAFLPKIISASQGAFVAGREISDNIILAQELVGELKTKTRGGNVLLKLDMAKAFDRVSWQFLDKMLASFGFSAEWRLLVRRCISNSWFSILINGEAAGYFRSSRGVRQGDPLSPALFIIAVEYLIRGIDRLFARRPDYCYANGSSMVVNSLSFADDVVIFCKGGKRALRAVMDFLQVYEKLSGQMVNLSKSSFTVGRHITPARRAIIHATTGFQETMLPITYLGVPLYQGKNKIFLFDNLVARVQRRLTGWDAKMLSMGGRLTLLKSVLLSMPLYLLQVMCAPNHVLFRLENIFNGFLWGDKQGARKIHWCSWARVCYPVAEGGLSIRRLSDLQDAYTYKLWFKFRGQQTLWAQYFANKYCLGMHPTQVHGRSLDSPTWRRMLRVRDEVEEHIGWALGCGDCSFKHDNWVGLKPLDDFLALSVIPYCKASEFMNGAEWNTGALRRVLPATIATIIESVPIKNDDRDVVMWTESNDGAFTLASTWSMCRQVQGVSLLHKLVWHMSIPLKHSLLAWRALYGWIPVDEILQRKGFSTASRCSCCTHTETIEHLFIHGRIAAEVWSHFFRSFGIIFMQANTLPQLLQCWFLSGDFCRQGHIRIIIPLAVLYYLWLGRNKARHEGSLMLTRQIISQIEQYIGSLHSANLVSIKQWRGDVDVARGWGLRLSTPAGRRPLLVSWCPPTSGFKLNVDGASKRSQQLAGGGGLIRNSEGVVLAAFSSSYMYCSAIEAEMQALRDGLLLCERWGITKVQVETDSVVLQLLVRIGKVNWRLLHLFIIVNGLIGRLQANVAHAYREGNQAADWLANNGCLSNRYETFTASTLPHPLKVIVARDARREIFLRC